MSRKILILFAHPAFHRSRANRALAEAARGLEGVTLHDLYETYPDLLVDVAREQKLLSEHDVVVFQHPFYWYSAPALMKEWMDHVLAHGWAYGRNGEALKGKIWTHAISAGAQAFDNAPEIENRFSIAELLRPFEAAAHVCGMQWREPYIVHASLVTGEAALQQAARGYRAHLLGLQRAG